MHIYNKLIHFYIAAPFETLLCEKDVKYKMKKFINLYLYY